MGTLKRLGDLFEPERATGERRIPAGGDNLAAAIFSLEPDGGLDEYIHHQPLVRPQIPGLPEWTQEIGDHEASLLEKLRKPPHKLLAVVGDMGSGKTMTMQFLVQKLLNETNCDHCPQATARDCHRQIMQVDFVRFSRPVSERQAVEAIAEELQSRAATVWSEEDEYYAYWQELADAYKKQQDREIYPVVNKLVNRYRGILQINAREGQQETEKRTRIRDGLAASDPLWHLQYMTLAWRYLLRTRFNRQNECAFIILDNLDSVDTAVQRKVVDIVQRNRHREGPLFVMLLRPETLRRHGLADVVRDVVFQPRLAPQDVVREKLRRFIQDPQQCFACAENLSKEEQQLYLEHLTRVAQRLSPGDHFCRFLDNAAGNSIRAALILAQGLCRLPINEMRKEDLTSHFLVRACVTGGGDQFVALPRTPICNPFDVRGAKEGRLMMKLRILWLVRESPPSLGIHVLRDLLEELNYHPDDILKALLDMTRLECQLLRTDGNDLLEEIWGDEHQNVELTEIGKGYIGSRGLVFDIDFVEEVALDASIEVDRRSTFANTHPIEKLRALRLFLRELLRADSQDAEYLWARESDPTRRRQVIGTLLSMQIIQSIYASIARISASQASRNPEWRADWEDLRSSYESLMRQAEQKYRELFGAEPLDDPMADGVRDN